MRDPLLTAHEVMKGRRPLGMEHYPSFIGGLQPIGEQFVLVQWEGGHMLRILAERLAGVRVCGGAPYV
jgi:hypothetical protein